MTPFGALQSRPDPVSVLVCESGRRWCDAARRFVGPFQHATRSAPRIRQVAMDQPIFVVQPAELSKVRAMLAGHKAIVILWEISHQNAPSVALTIAQIGVGRPDVLQLAAIGDAPSRQSNDLSLRILELGVSALVRSPEEFASIARMIRRRFSAQHP